jgi:hypothetical protein
MTFHSLAQVRVLLGGFDVVQLHEQDEHGPSYAGPKHWHVFHVIATKPPGATDDGIPLSLRAAAATFLL